MSVLPGTLVLAHEGHGHGAETPPVAANVRPRVTAHSELYELVGVLNGTRLAIHVDRFDTNEPVTDASLAVDVGDGKPVAADRSEDGVYSITSPRLGVAGAVELVFEITGGAGDDLLIGTLSVPSGGSTTGSAAPGAPAWRTWANSMPAVLHNALALGVLTFGFGILAGYFVRGGRVVPAIATGTIATAVFVVLVGSALGHEGHDQGAAQGPPAAGLAGEAPRRMPDGSAFVPKTTQRLLEVRTVVAKPQTVQPAVNLIGRVTGDPNRTSVVQSINGGRVIAPESGLPRIGQRVVAGAVLARIEPTVPQADRTTIAEKAGEIEQLIAVAESKLARIRSLAERNVVPQSQVIDGEIELDGLRRRRDVMLQFRTEPEVLRAPTAGIIAAAKVLPGQVVQGQDILFQIVDPDSLWVEALVHGDIDPASLAGAEAVSAAGQTMTLSYVGFGRALQQQAAVTYFAIASPSRSLNVGQPVTVVAKRGEAISGLVLPREAVVRSDSGQAMVWRHAEPERFEPVPVRTQPLDAARVVVAAGMREGDRIVVRGANLVNQIR